MEPGKSLLKVVVWGMLLALALGMVLGWLRYWLGLFVLAQGTVAGLLLPWLLGRLDSGRALWSEYPGCGGALGLAALWSACFLAGQGLGFGLAQPWFDPLGFVFRVLAGRSSEFVFGIAATAGIHRALALGAKGGFWVLINLLDLGIMFFFFWVLPGRGGGESREQAGSPATRPEVPS